MTEERHEPEYLAKLNPEQYKAATSIYGRNFILAGAGSGKTATLVARVAYMLDNGIPPEGILLLTFTNKAAKEMKERIISLSDYRASSVTACTFHSFCAAFLRLNITRTGISTNFTVLDSTDAADAVSLAKEEFLEEKKKNGMPYDLKDFPKAALIATINEAAVNNCVTYDEVLSHRDFEDVRVYSPEIKDILERFRRYKAERNLLDYNDLLFYTEKILAEDEFLRSHTDEHYKFISCDEYQDTNTIQNRILEHLSRDYPNLTVVGDDNQSIYAFRFANINNILNFDKTYPDCRTIILDTNYRSTQELLDFSNVMMSHAIEGKKKWLKGLSHGERPHLIYTNGCYEEADFILDKIQNRTYALKDMAVIARSAAQTYILEARLNALKIPFNKYGGMKFLERYVIKNILAYLRISVNGRDEIAMFRVLQLYPGIGKTRAQSFAKLFAEQGKTAVMNACKGKDYQIYILELIDTMKSLTGMNLNEQLEYLIKRYYPMVIERSIRQQKTNDGKKSEQLGRLIIDLSDAEALIVMAESYRDASHFLEDLVLDAAVDNRYEDKLNISTIHSAKGLEYDTVFVMDCIEGVTPRCPAGHPNDPEELRCMYVAVTRAKKELYLMVPEYYNMKNCHGNITHFLNRPDILATLDSNGEDHSFAKTADEFWL